jgi:hypothetical protein
LSQNLLHLLTALLTAAPGVFVVLVLILLYRSALRVERMMKALYDQLNGGTEDEPPPPRLL